MFSIGYVYVVECPEANACKIGISEIFIEERFANIQVGCPYKLGKRWISENIPNFRECEKKLHGIFQSKRKSGEWFDVDFLNASIIADKICKTGYTIQLEEKTEELQNSINELREIIEIKQKRIEKLYSKFQLIRKRLYDTGLDKLFTLDELKDV